MPEIDNKDFIPKPKNNPHKAIFRWVRAFAAVAAVFIVVIFGSVTAKAFGFDVWKAVIQWTQETFHFSTSGNPNSDNNLPYASLQEALETGKITTSLAPTWFPDGYELVDITIMQNPAQKIYRAKYINKEQTLKITVQQYLTTNPIYVEQSDGLVEEYVVSGIAYYIFANHDNVKAVWIVDSYECYISGDVTIDELKQMIDSIVKG